MGEYMGDHFPWKYHAWGIECVCGGSMNSQEHCDADVSGYDENRD